MATIKDFKKIALLEGITGYILVKKNGPVLASNSEHTATLAPLIQQAVISGQSLESPLTSKPCTYISVEDGSGETLTIIPLGSIFLGVTQNNDYDHNQLMESVFTFLQGLPQNS